MPPAPAGARGRTAGSAWVRIARAPCPACSDASGEAGLAGIPILQEDGSVDWGTGAFVMTFVIVVNWTLLQVSVAVVRT